MIENTPKIREMAEQAGKKKFLVGGLAYVAIGDDATSALARGGPHFKRYYGAQADPEQGMHAGTIDEVAQAIKEYEPAGLDVLWIFPEIPDVKQVEQIAENILPTYRVPSR